MIRGLAFRSAALQPTSSTPSSYLIHRLMLDTEIEAKPLSYFDFKGGEKK
jgi:hypothetical protein